MNTLFKPELSPQEKVEILKTRGSLAGCIDADDFILSLYSINGTYVEVFYSIAQAKVAAVKIVEDPRRLDLYKWPDIEPYGIAS